jgi:hypothetical protein
MITTVTQQNRNNAEVFFAFVVHIGFCFVYLLKKQVTSAANES